MNEYRAYPNVGNPPETYNVRAKHQKLSYTRPSKKDDQEEVEKNVAKGLFRICEEGGLISLLQKDGMVGQIGKIVDFEVPLHHPGNRNIDLVSVDGDNIYLLELKKNHAKETLLRCILEAYTYSRIAERDVLRRSFGVADNGRIVICPLFFEDSQQYRDYEELSKGDRPALKSLIDHIKEVDKEIDIRFACLDTSKDPDFPDFNKTSFDIKWWH